MLDEDSLRHAVIEALGAHADSRALEIVQHARVVVVPGVRQWVGSSGTVHAHAVHLFVDAHALAVVRAHPAVHDQLVAAFASAIAREGNHSLHELNAYWGFESARPEHAYRAGPAHEVDRADADAVKRGLAAYLAARGESGAAERVRRAELAVAITEKKASVTVRFAAADARWFEADARAAKAIEEASEALLQVPGVVHVRVKRSATG
jgi:hypothetical protein